MKSINFSAIITKSNIFFAVSFLSQYLQNLIKKHVDAANHIISYFNSIFNRIIMYNGRNLDKIFLCVNDAAFVDDFLVKKSSNDYFFQLYEGLIDGRAIKQLIVIIFSIEAELLILTRTIKKIMGWKKFFEIIQFDNEEKFRIRCNNRQTLKIISKNMLKLNIKLRHIDIHCHGLRQEMQIDKIDTKWISTIEMPVDGFIKRLFKLKHDEFVKQLNLIDIIDFLKINVPDGKIGLHSGYLIGRNMLNSFAYINDHVINYLIGSFNGNDNCGEYLISNSLKAYVFVFTITLYLVHRGSSRMRSYKSRLSSNETAGKYLEQMTVYIDS